MSVPFLQSNAGNFTEGRAGHSIIIGVLHRTAIQGDNALGEATYSHNHVVKASWYKVVDLVGRIFQSVLSTVTEWATDDWGLNQESVNYELCGLNHTALTSLQMAGLVADVKADPACKGIAHKRLTLAEIATRKVSGWCTHADITAALKIAGGHTDTISDAEFVTFLAGISK